MRHPRLYPLLTLALSAAALAACNSTASVASDPDGSTTPTPNQGIVAGTLDVKADSGHVTLRNGTEFIVGYMVVDKDMATVALFPPCGQQCPTVVQGASKSVAYSAIAGYTNRSTEAIVMWWTYTRAANGTLTPQGGVQTTRIRL